MTTRRTLTPPIHFSTDSVHADIGRGLAKDAWFSTGEGKSLDAAALSLAEALMEDIINESPEDVAAVLYGACSMLLDLAGTPIIKPVASAKVPQ